MNNTKNININEEIIKDQLTLEEARVLLGEEFKRLARSYTNSPSKIKDMLDIFNTLFPEFIDNRIQFDELKPYESLDKEMTIFIDGSSYVKKALNIEDIEKNNNEVDVFLGYLDRETLEFKNIISEIESKKDEATIREDKDKCIVEAALQTIETIKNKIDQLKECTKLVKDKCQK